METYCAHQIFNDFDEFTESARGWSGDFRQLKPGRFQCESLQYIQGNVQFMHARMNQHIEQLGSSPKGQRTFAIPAVPHLRLNWLGVHVPEDIILIFQPERGLDCISWNDFDMFVFSMPEEEVLKLCLTLGHPSLPKIIEQSDIIRCDPNALRELRRVFAMLDATLLQCADQNIYPLREDIEYTIPTMLIRALSSAKEAAIARPVRMRDHVVRQIKGYIGESPDMAPKVRELCSMFRVSERTLEYAFREHFGIAPKQYLKTHRLNKVRKILRQGLQDKAKIVDIANRFGFWHMGQFAADYRKLFGELPSETLHKHI